jgi:predicted esterase
MGLEGPCGGIRTTALLSLPASLPPDAPVPLLVALHGHGDNAAAFHDLWKPSADSLGMALLTPQGDGRADGVPGGRTWGRCAERSVLAALDAAAGTVFVHPGRVYLAGFSMGGSLCLKLGLGRPGRFRGMAVLGAGDAYRGPPDRPERLRSTRVFLGHGGLEANVAQARRFHGILEAAGVEARLSVYPGIGHSLPEPMQEELRRILGYLFGGEYAPRAPEEPGS